MLRVQLPAVFKVRIIAHYVRRTLGVVHFAETMDYLQQRKLLRLFLFYSIYVANLVIFGLT